MPKKIEIHKEFWCSQMYISTASIEAVGASLELILMFVAIAKEDYPELTDDLIRLIHYKSGPYRGRLGIHFKRPIGKEPCGYIEIRQGLW